MLNSLDEDNERTYLYTFQEVCKIIMVHHVIPETDAECNFDWRSLRYKSRNICGDGGCRFEYKFDNFYLGVPFGLFVTETTKV